MRILTVAVLLALAASSAHAEEFTDPEADAAGRRADRISTLATLLPVAAGGIWWVVDQKDLGRVSGSDLGYPPAALIGAGLVVGPSLGYLCGGATGRGVTGLTLRTVGLGISVAMASGLSQKRRDLSSLPAAVLAITIAGLVPIPAALDVAAADRTVRERAQSRERRVTLRLGGEFQRPQAVAVSVDCAF